ncbi:DUF1488 domain-containing protein [Amorphus sp. 3PC139-8]|uniref:DUF1488 domain-containing protein n=1 Tax=Amorphus sp. 3PC139-8 TaxID=2735676 RepID=UPI00345D990F
MTLSFINPSRSYDPRRRLICFVGHDGMFEIPFFLEVNAIPAFSARASTSEEDLLSAFDKARGTIEGVASEAYSHRRQREYVLTSRDFR